MGLKNKIQNKIKTPPQGKNITRAILPNSGNMWRGLDRKNRDYYSSKIYLIMKNILKEDTENLLWCVTKGIFITADET